ncbi:translation initiation factor IF-2-like [Sciurus carolinensis]|uniref:translation initiation factor IF-2-like n=1 Tax=Sciurus carolinensis TaxID=30640 RepID=UPI001FB4A0DD|nr:translation initiation factor IF-2-like [Sciurus carolinensis]
MAEKMRAQGQRVQGPRAAAASGTPKGTLPSQPRTKPRSSVAARPPPAPRRPPAPPRCRLAPAASLPSRGPREAQARGARCGKGNPGISHAQRRCLQTARTAPTSFPAARAHGLRARRCLERWVRRLPPLHRSATAWRPGEGRSRCNMSHSSPLPVGASKCPGPRHVRNLVRVPPGARPASRTKPAEWPSRRACSPALLHPRAAEMAPATSASRRGPATWDLPEAAQLELGTGRTPALSNPLSAPRRCWRDESHCASPRAPSAKHAQRSGGRDGEDPEARSPVGVASCSPRHRGRLALVCAHARGVYTRSVAGPDTPGAQSPHGFTRTGCGNYRRAGAPAIPEEKVKADALQMCATRAIVSSA